MTTELERDLSPAGREERDIELGPFFASGVILIVYGLKRRRKLAVAAGLAAIWVDQRSELGRGIKQQDQGPGRADGRGQGDQPAEESSL